MRNNTQTESPIVCNMSALAPEQRKAHLATSKALFSMIEQVIELTNGYEFRLASNPNVIVGVAEFISLERLCCPFLSFELEVEADGGPMRLRLTGRDGVKAFIREEISGLLGAEIDWKSSPQKITRSAN